MGVDRPDNEALQFGKEFGNRGQCSPTYFTVGNLVKHLTHLRDEHGMATEEIIDNHVFMTAGACGPCRFGTYVTEYRKALRDAGFDGFRVMLFQQQGGEAGHRRRGRASRSTSSSPRHHPAAARRRRAQRLIGYRMRPYEVTRASHERRHRGVQGDPQVAMVERKEHRRRAVHTCRRHPGNKVEVDRTSPSPSSASSASSGP